MKVHDKSGVLNHAKYLHEQHNIKCTKEAITTAAYNGHLDVVKYLFKNRFEDLESADLDKIASSGQLEATLSNICMKITLKGAQQKRWAAEQCHLCIIKYLHGNRTEGCTNGAMNCAANYGHLNIVKYLHEIRTEGCTKMQ
ncbi:hypothetical protein THRCLA_20624 [Thraustotheca clavata]|uniref:Ankyrin repeat n=1 Tax=Thraustotheca clavata TaxID=74557 RepID=A0A1W0A5G4_9STRA|nr:hypothetical protein THRCLA_20624 [Thraustotheca clavata]